MPSPPAHSLRIALESDAENLARLINRAFVSERFFSDEDRTSPNGVREYLKKGVFILAEDAGELIGCVYLEPRGNRFYLGLLSVETSRQGRGMGSFLMKAAEEHCRAYGTVGIDLQVVDVRKDLPAYYRRFGYTQTGNAPFPEHVKTKIPCRFLVLSKELK